MSLESQIREAVRAAVSEALERDLPAHLSRLAKPVDPEQCRSIKDTAEYLGVTVSCVRERISAGELETIRLGKYVLIPHRSVQALITRQLDRKRFARDQSSAGEASDMDDEINAALGLTSPSTRAKRASKKEARPTRRA